MEISKWKDRITLQGFKVIFFLLQFHSDKNNCTVVARSQGWWWWLLLLLLWWTGYSYRTTRRTGIAANIGKQPFGIASNWRKVFKHVGTSWTTSEFPYQTPGMIEFWNRCLQGNNETSIPSSSAVHAHPVSFSNKSYLRRCEPLQSGASLKLLASGKSRG